jgi:hypothetical protein
MWINMVFTKILKCSDTGALSIVQYNKKNKTQCLETGSVSILRWRARCLLCWVPQKELISFTIQWTKSKKKGILNGIYVAVKFLFFHISEEKNPNKHWPFTRCWWCYVLNDTSVVPILQICSGCEVDVPCTKLQS